MRKIKLFFILTFMVLLANGVDFADNKNATYGVDSDFPPFSYIIDGNPSGFESDLIKMIFSTGNYKLDMQLGYTWDEIYNNTKNGTLDICGTIVKTESRAKEVLYTDDVYTRYFGVFTTEKNISIDYKHLENYKLGAVKGYYSEIIVKDEIKASQYKVYNTYEEMISGLLNNEVDAFIESTNVIKYYIEKNDLIGQLVLGKDGLFPLSVPFGVSKQRPDLVEYINLRLKALKASGDYEMLYMKTFSSHSDYYYEQQKKEVLFILLGFLILTIMILVLIQFYIRFLRKKVQNEQGYSKLIVDSASAMIVLYNMENGFESFNQYACDLTGYMEQDVLGDKWEATLFPDTSQSIQFKQWIANFVPGETLQQELLCKSGKVVTVLFRISGIETLHDHHKKHVLFGTDITEIQESKRRLSESYLALENSTAELEEINAEYEASIDQLEREVETRKKIESELLEANKKADVINVAKDYFLANMSHEIRTPMNGFMGMIQLMNMTSLSEEQHKYITIMETSSKALLKIVNEIMDYSKIESGKMELDNKEYDLRKLLSEVNDLFEPSILLKSLNIEIDIDKNIPDVLYGDSFKLKQILSNLLSNSLKFTSKGTIKISTKIQSIKPGHSLFLEFQVRDTGIGIPEEKMPLLFSRFTQIDISHTRKYGGTGLGLSISKGLVELMGGNIWVESKVDEGSCFYFTCEMSLHSISDYKPSNHSPLTKPLKLPQHLNVLLVEDDLTSQLIIQTLFTKKGWTITVANNGQEALDILDNETFDLILMDCQMPIMDGFKATQLIREFESSFRHTRIIAMTAHTLPGDYSKCIEAGMDHYISKPLNFNELMTLISEVDF